MLRIVAVAMTTVAAGGCPAMSAFKDAQVDTAKHDVRMIAQQVAQYREVKRGKCPNGAADLASAGIASKLPADPWETEYRVTCPGDGDAIDVRSAGPDKTFDTDDDITNADDGGS